MKSFLIQAYLSGNQLMREFIASHGQISQVDLKALQVLDSQHVREVVVRFVETIGQQRLYLALTHNGTHSYHVRFHTHVCTDGTSFRVGKCDCRAGCVPVEGFEGEQEFGLCRHIVAASCLMSAQTGEDFYAETVSRYRGHLPKLHKSRQLSSAPPVVKKDWIN